MPRFDYFFHGLPQAFHRDCTFARMGEKPDFHTPNGNDGSARAFRTGFCLGDHAQNMLELTRDGNLIQWPWSEFTLPHWAVV
jgi:hypothetical protein